MLFSVEKIFRDEVGKCVIVPGTVNILYIQEMAKSSDTLEDGRTAVAIKFISGEVSFVVGEVEQLTRAMYNFWYATLHGQMLSLNKEYIS